MSVRWHILDGNKTNRAVESRQKIESFLAWFVKYAEYLLLECFSSIDLEFDAVKYKIYRIKGSQQSLTYLQASGLSNMIGCNKIYIRVSRSMNKLHTQPLTPVALFGYLKFARSLGLGYNDYSFIASIDFLFS